MHRQADCRCGHQFLQQRRPAGFEGTTTANRASVKHSEQHVVRVDVFVDPYVPCVGVFVFAGNIAGEVIDQGSLGFRSRINTQQRDCVRIESRCWNDVQQRLLRRSSEVCRVVAGKTGAAGSGAVVEGIAHVTTFAVPVSPVMGSRYRSLGIWRVVAGVENRTVRKCASQCVGCRAAVVFDVVLKIRKAAVDHIRGRDSLSTSRYRQHIPSSLVVEKPECLAFAIQYVRDENRSARRSSKQVLVIGRDGLLATPFTLLK